MKEQSIPGKILSLEILRFAAAISVLIWHYQHFAYINDIPVYYIREKQPLYNFLFPLYRTGHAGVELFWCLSGYIFFWKYRELISKESINFKKFMILRFSRLYPLHIVTLLIVAILQYFYLSKNGGYFVFQNNNLKHFILQLFMACNWGFENGPNFNWPVWSVSVEVLVYIIFFMVMRYLGTSLVYNILLVVGAAFLSYFFGSPITTCLVYFFLGGIIISLQSSFKGRFKILMTLGVLLYFLLIFIVYRKTLDEHIFFVGAFPSIVYFFTEYFKCPKFAEKWVEMLGNLTYSSYLIHFPFQLAIAVIFSYLGKKIPFYNVYFLLGYLFIVLILARLIYSYFETPAQNFLRKKFLKRNSKKTSQSLKFDIGV